MKTTTASTSRAGSPVAASSDTVKTLTDSILSVYGDEAQPDTWRAYVSAVQDAFGSHPIGAAHAKPVPAAFAAKWRAAFGITPAAPAARFVAVQLGQTEMNPAKLPADGDHVRDAAGQTWRVSREGGFRLREVDGIACHPAFLAGPMDAIPFCQWVNSFL